MNAPQQHAAGARLVEVDALRGVAAMAVVLFHYTTRFVDLYGGGAGGPSLSAPYGHFGVNLFFVISGFVIFMTLERTKRPMDFVVSRFSRLFPAYWVAVAVTFAVVSWAGLPGKEVTGLQALGNGLMLHGFLGIPHVDGVYWTLQVELFFYAWMLLLFVTGHLSKVHVALWVFIGVRLLYHVAAVGFGVDLPWRLSQVLITNYIPWFALGICVYQAARKQPLPRVVVVTGCVAVACLAVVDGWTIGLLALAFATLVWAAASGRARWLGNPVLAFLGAISYPLYLLHENIGWVVQRAVQAQGWSFDASIAAALVVAVGMATVLTFTVERPVMRAIRRRYAGHTPPRRP